MKTTNKAMKATEATKAMKETTNEATKDNNQKENKEVKATKATEATTKEMKDNDQRQTAPATAKATETKKETSKAMKENSNNNEVKAMETTNIEQLLQELENKKKALKQQLNEQKRAQRLEYQIEDKVVNLLERFAQTGVQLIANANAIYEGTKDDNISNLSMAISKSVEGLNPLLQIFGIDLQQLRNNVKPLSARGNKTDRTPRKQRKLADYGIKDGDRLIYAPTGDAYEVLDNGVIVEGKRYALSTAVKILQNNPGGNYSGYRFFRLPDHAEILEDTAVIE